MKRYLLLATMVVASVVAKAQEEGFSKQIEVHKEYEVVVKVAERIESEVALLDTTIVRPELSYRIRPTAHLTSFSSSSLRPIEIATADWEVPHRLYLNVGGGLPLQSEADIYWSPVQNSHSHLALWLNHEGTEGRVTNLSEERVAALMLRNKAGVRYKTLVGKNTSLSAGVKYRGSLGRAYGGVGTVGNHPFVSVNDLEANVNISGGFGAKSPLLYDANAMGLYAWNNSGEDVWRFNVNYGLLGLNKIRSWLPNRVTLHWSGVQSDAVGDNNPEIGVLYDYYDTSVTFVPEWSLRIGKNLPVEIMVGYDHMIYKGAKNSLDGVVASIATSFDKYSFAVPYLTLTNDVQTKLTRDYLWESPFMAMAYPDTRKVFLAEVGVRGESGEMTYKLSGSSRYFTAYLYEVVVVGEPRLACGRSTGQRVWYADAELGWHPSERLDVRALLGYTALGTAESSTAHYSPRKWNATVEARWMPMDRLTVGAKCEWKSAMEVAMIEATTQSVLEVPSYVDLGLEAEWLGGESWSVWLRGENLLNQEIYHWATYRSLGIGARIGVRMSF